MSNLTIPPEEQRSSFLSLKTPREIANLLEINYGRLVYHLYKIPDDDKYKTFHIPKKSGGAREIHSPVTALKIIQRKLNEILQNVYNPKPSVFSYIYGRNIVQNASRHRKKRYVFNLDLEDFFPTINFGRVRGLFLSKPYGLPESVATVLSQICCYKNQLPQGAPTSPIVSNMICAKMDSELQEFSRINKCFYTRYADDISISTSLKEFPTTIANWISLTEVEVSEELENIITANGFRINKMKVRLQPWFRRQQVTGLTVNEFPNVRRNYVRQIRAMLHAWDRYGVASAEEEFFTMHDDKYRNEEMELPSFRQVVKGKIDFLGMVRGTDNQIYRKLQNRYSELSLRDKGILSFGISSIDELQKPKICVEGKTDKAILSTAWNKLFNGTPMPFIIQNSDPFEKSSSSGGSGGTRALCIHLNSIRDTTSFITIGLFDRDQAGLKAYERDLHKDYVEDSENYWKISPRRKSGALLLPVPEGKELYGYYKNLSIEFYFNEDTLTRKTDEGYGLEFKFPSLEVAGIEIANDEEIKIPETRVITKGKTVFAVSIVPSFEKEEFLQFEQLFHTLLEFIKVIQEEGQP